MTASAAYLTNVNVVHAIRPGAGRDTAIDKRPVAGPVVVGELGLAGDRQCDRDSHGGPDRALYAYASEDAAWWAAELDREIPAGWFGENLTTCGLDVTGARIGERWRIGEPGRDGVPGRGVLVEVRLPRVPCANLSYRMGDPGFHKRFAASRRVGAYLKVVETGSIEAGDRIVVENRPDHDLTVGGYYDRPGPDLMRGVLDSGVDLAGTARRRALRIAAHGG